MISIRDKFRLGKIFEPGLVEEIAAVVEENKRFVIYTSADTAMKIVRNDELWFRNAAVMNEFSEISYGLELINAVFSGPEGIRFRETVEDIFPGTMKKSVELLEMWKKDMHLDTYIACVSIHNPDEDQCGRLSMWRAYGDTALVMNNRPLMEVTDLLTIRAIPVRYLSEAELIDHLVKVTNAIQVTRKFLKNLGQESLVEHIHEMIFRFALTTKPPGFKEEKEWRLIYRPTVNECSRVTEETVVLGGVPQKICKLRLTEGMEKGADGTDIPPLLDRIIIGPSEFPHVISKAFVDVLSSVGVEDAESKVVLSDLPLRVSA